MLAAETHVNVLRTKYAKINGVTVQPFKFHMDDLNPSRLVALLADEPGQPSGLPVEALVRALEVSLDQGPFSVGAFLQVLSEKADELLTPSERTTLDRRLVRLGRWVNQDRSLKTYFQPGQLIVIDVSSVIIQPGFVNALLAAAVSTFLEVQGRKVIAVDNAHKVR